MPASCLPLKEYVKVIKILTKSPTHHVSKYGKKKLATGSKVSADKKLSTDTLTNTKTISSIQAVVRE